MRLTILLVIMIGAITASCRTEVQKKQEASQLAQKRFQEIDLSQPDKYPLFDGCGELDNAANCFFEKLQEQVLLKLNDHHLQFEMSQRDSVMVQLLVDKKGNISYQGLQSDVINDRERTIDSLLRVRLQHICKIEPAYKQNVPINSSYLLPVILKPATVQPDDLSN
ncbi:hypothetical protein JCM19298_2412 [Nonlabens ulvanivorans]|nr:hypothetical protein JCM19298_2412 [Nonlabens ulvanivorans]